MWRLRFFNEESRDGDALANFAVVPAGWRLSWR